MIKEELQELTERIYWEHEFLSSSYKKHKIVMRVYQACIYNFKVLGCEWITLSQIWQMVNELFNSLSHQPYKNTPLSETLERVSKQDLTNFYNVPSGSYTGD